MIIIGTLIIGMIALQATEDCYPAYANIAPGKCSCNTMCTFHT